MSTKDFLNEVFAKENQAKPESDLYAVDIEKLKEHNVKFIMVRESQTPLRKEDMKNLILEEDPSRIKVFKVF